jgi:hypothetical protein
VGLKLFRQLGPEIGLKFQPRKFWSQISIKMRPFQANINQNFNVPKCAKCAKEHHSSAIQALKALLAYYKDTVGPHRPLSWCKGPKNSATYFWLISANRASLDPWHCKFQKGTANDTVAVLKQMANKSSNKFKA